MGCTNSVPESTVSPRDTNGPENDEVPEKYTDACDLLKNMKEAWTKVKLLPLSHSEHCKSSCGGWCDEDLISSDMEVIKGDIYSCMFDGFKDLQISLEEDYPKYKQKLDKEYLPFAKEVHEKIITRFLEYLTDKKIRGEGLRDEIKRLLEDRHPDDPRCDSEKLNALYEEGVANAAAYEEQCTGAEDEAWKKFKEEYDAEMDKVKAPMRKKFKQLQSEYEAFKSECQAIDAKPSKKLNKGDQLEAEIDEFDEIGRRKDNVPVDGNVLYQKLGSERWAIAYSSEIEKAWEKYEVKQSEIFERVSKKHYPDGTSEITPYCWPCKVVGTFEGHETASFSVPYEFTPMDERQYEREHGKNALMELQRRLSYDNVGTLVYSDSGIQHYKWKTNTANLPKLQMQSMEHDDWFLVFPGHSTI